MKKAEVTKILKSIPGWRSFCFNYERRMPPGAVGFPDYCLVSPSSGCVVFIEAKLGNDKLNAKQEEVRQDFREVAKKNNNLKYFLLTENNIHEIVQEIIRCGA